MPATIVLTMMVRDEADIIGAMIDHHLAQGVDRIIVTDNGSIDGTTEILEEYAGRDAIDLRHDPVHRKQQGVVVTDMARDAATRYGADWVVNADADEFWLPLDRSMTLHDALEATPRSVGAFTVPVVDMIGRPALDGRGFDRLRYRDLRSDRELQRVGLHAHSTPDAVHIGDPEIVVYQGNHYVNREGTGAPPPSAGIEVLHLPWRSWAQFRRKVENAGKGYEANPELKPSPNHHGMREYRRLLDGTLYGWYLLRHPTALELEAGLLDGTYVEDDVLARTFPGSGGVAIEDDDASLALRAALALSLRRATDRDEAVETSLERLGRVEDAAVALEASNRRLERENAELRGLVEGYRARRIVRLVDRLADAGPRRS